MTFIFLDFYNSVKVIEECNMLLSIKDYIYGTPICSEKMRGLRDC